MYGLAGIALLAATLLLTLASVGTVEGLARSLRDEGPGGVPARIAVVGSALDDARDALDGFESTLGGTSDAAQSGERLSRRLATSLRRLSTALDVTILGTRPFAGVGTEFQSVASEADALADDLDSTSTSLELNRAALRGLATELGDLRDQLDALRGTMASPVAGGTTGGLVPAAETFALSRLVLVLLLAWLALPATVAVALGIRRLRGRPQPAEAPLGNPGRGPGADAA